MTSPIVTRFAPSPTGFLHIGGARTALFNWLYARGRGGKFLLRIEDTDRARHNEAAVDAILDGLRWLGVDWDDEPVSQFSRRTRHVDVAQDLIAKGAAYRCFMTPEEIDAAREKALAEKARFESPWRHADPKAIDEKIGENTPYTVRFKAPHEGRTAIHDAVQKDVSFPNDALDDLIILRSNGEPTYNLAVVVDDHDMGVTHIIRGDDHLNNAARQQQIYEALGWSAPVFGHVPLIHGQDGAKLSKRHGALGVEAYRDDGFLSDTMANYLLRLGWAHGDDEIIPRDKALEWFDLSGVNKAPARLDIEKLTSLNAHYISQLTTGDFVEKTAPFFEDNSTLQREGFQERLTRAAPFLKPRMNTLKDINEAAAFLSLVRPFEITGKPAKPLKKEGALERLGELRNVLADVDDWSAPEPLDEALQQYAAQNDLGFGQIGPLLRAALTAGRPAPGIGEVLYSLGREESLARLQDQAAD